MLWVAAMAWRDWVRHVGALLCLTGAAVLWLGDGAGLWALALPGLCLVALLPRPRPQLPNSAVFSRMNSPVCLLLTIAVLLPPGAGGLWAKPLSDGAVRLDVPARWEISATGTALLSTIARDPEGQGWAGIASVPVAGGNGADAFEAYSDALVRVLMPEGAPAGRMVALPPWDHAARLGGMMDWVGRGRFASTIELRAAQVGERLDIAVVAWPDGAPQEKLDAVLSALFTARPGGAASGEEAVTADVPAPDAPRVLFAGEPGDRWRTVDVSGGSFEDHGRFASGAMRVDIPAGHAWAKIGIRSAAPLLHFAPGAPASAQELRFEFDPAETSAYVLAIAGRDGRDEWAVHNARFSWARAADGRSGTARVFVRRKEAGALPTGPDAPGFVLMRVDSRGALRVTLPDGQFIDARLRAVPEGGGYHIHALTNAREPEAPAALALTRITLTAGLAPAVAVPAFPDIAGESVLFDGGLGHIWRHHAAHGGDFAAHAQLTSEGLQVRIPEGSGWGKAGLLSDTGPVWLTGLTEGAEVGVTFEIEPEATSGFVLALTQSGWGGVRGNDPGKPRALFFWRRPAGAETALADFSLSPEGTGGDLSSVAAPQDAPGHVRFVLRRGEITIAPEGMAPFTRPWPMAADGAAFNIYAYAHPAEADAAADFHLRAIRIARKPGQPSGLSAPAPGVAPLPAETLFEGRASPAWEPIGVAGGDFEAFARYDGGRLVIDVPADSSWGKTGLLSVDPLVRLDKRIWRTPTRIELKLETGKPQNLNMSLSTRRTADMWGSHKAWLSLSYVADRDRWVLALRDSPYDTWSYDIDPDWMRAQWDGRLWVDLGNEWGAVEIPGGPRLRTNLSIGDGHHLYAVVQAHPPGEDKAAHLGLERVSVQVLTPEGMTATERWGMLDPDRFDPQGFLEDLAASIDGPTEWEAME